MISWTEKRICYYGIVPDDPYFPIKWKTAPTLYDAVIKGKALLQKNYGSDLVQIQTAPKQPSVGPNIASYEVGQISKDQNNRYIFSQYTSKSFNVKPYCKNYIIKGRNIIEVTR